MASKHEEDSTRTVASVALFLLLLGFLVVLAPQSDSVLESGSGMRSHWMPGTGPGGQGTTPSTGTSGAGPGTTTPSSADTSALTSVIEGTLTPTNNTADNL